MITLVGRHGVWPCRISALAEYRVRAIAGEIWRAIAASANLTAGPQWRRQRDMEYRTSGAASERIAMSKRRGFTIIEFSIIAFGVLFALLAVYWGLGK